jgi:predicted dehydrogenase
LIHRAIQGVRVRIAVVGCGYWGAKHIRVLSSLPQVEQVVAVDQNVASTAALARSFPGLVTAVDIHEAIPLIDAAIIATPPRTHAPLALGLLRAGKHVLVEKPMATSVSDAEEMIRVAAENGVTLMTGHTFEYNAAVRALRQTLLDGELGDIRYIDTARLNLGLYQRDVNVVWDLAPHDISIINYVLDSEPASVHAWGLPHATARFEDVAYLSLRYPDLDAMAHIHVSWLDPCKVRRVTLVGSRRMAVYNDLVDEGRIKIYDKGVALPEPADQGSPPMSYRYGGIYSPYIEMNEPLKVEDEHFLECIASGAEPLSGGQSGLSVVRVLEGAEKSLRTGMPVDLRPAAPKLTIATRRSALKESGLARAATTTVVAGS